MLRAELDAQPVRFRCSAAERHSPYASATREVLPPGHPDGTGLLWQSDVARIHAVDALLQSAGMFQQHFAVNVGAQLWTSSGQGVASKSDAAKLARTRDYWPLWHDLGMGVLLRRGWSGVVFDSQSSLWLLEAVLNLERRTNVTVRAELLDPVQAAATLRQSNVPTNLGLLKVDIDSVDCAIMRAILEGGFRPTLIHVEAYPGHAPGVRAELILQSGGTPPRHAPPGCSCAAIAALGRKFGYRTLSVEGEDVTLVLASAAAKANLNLRMQPGCTPSCGNFFCDKTECASCKPQQYKRSRSLCNQRKWQWARWVEEGKWDQLANDTAWELARRGWTGTVGTDFGQLSLKVWPNGAVTSRVARQPDLMLDSDRNVAVPYSSSHRSRYGGNEA